MQCETGAATSTTTADRREGAQETQGETEVDRRAEGEGKRSKPELDRREAGGATSSG